MRSVLWVDSTLSFYFAHNRPAYLIFYHISTIEKTPYCTSKTYLRVQRSNEKLLFRIKYTNIHTVIKIINESNSKNSCIILHWFTTSKLKNTFVVLKRFSVATLLNIITALILYNGCQNRTYSHFLCAMGCCPHFEEEECPHHSHFYSLFLKSLVCSEF